jgi:hypothetical protein
MANVHVRRVVLVVALLMLAASSSLAADLTAFIGGVKPGKLTLNNVKNSFDSSPVFGFRLGVPFIVWLGMEHTVAFSSDYLFPRNLSAITSAKGFIYKGNLILNFPVKKVVPYLTFGAGVIHQYGSKYLPVGTKLAFNYGGGLKLPKMKGPLGLRFDVRGYTAGVLGDKINILEVSGGLLISFKK